MDFIQLKEAELQKLKSLEEKVHFFKKENVIRKIINIHSKLRIGEKNERDK